MSEQREKPITPLHSDLLDYARTGAGFVSGTMIENFREGWAKVGGAGDRVHYFVRDGFDGVVSRCHLIAEVRWMYGEGNYPRCKRCARIAAKADRQR